MKYKHSNIVTLAILTLVTVFFWLVFNVYRRFSQKPPEVVPTEVLNPIDPKLDTKTLEEIKTRYYIEEGNIPDNPVVQTPSPSLSKPPTPQATISVSPSINPTPTSLE